MGSAYMYPDLDAARAAVSACGEQIARVGLNPDVGPMTFVFTGTGKVADGAQEIFKLLPHEYVSPSDLKYLVESKDADPRKLYACVATAEDMVEKEDGTFDKVRVDPEGPGAAARR